MRWQVVSLNGTPARPWRNGGGLTRELLAWPDAAGWRVRLSVAEVTRDGPFSRFEGIERWFAVLDGQGVVLRMKDADRTLTPADAPCRFDGDLAVDCRLLGGATRDFNLMAAPGKARLQRVQGVLDASSEAAMLWAVYTHAQPARLAGPGYELQLAPHHLAWCECTSGDRAQVQAGQALWIEAS